MRARLVPCAAAFEVASTGSGPAPTLMTRLFRGTLAVAGLSWICFASTLCGCNSINGYVMNESGKAYYRRGDYTAARHEFERALMDSPENPHYAYNVAAAMQQQGDTMAAETMYQHALVIDPGHEPSYEGLAHLLYKNGRTSEAEQLLTAWSETQPYDEDASLSLARMQENMGNPAAADLAYQRALAANPRTGRANDGLGNRHRRAARRREAMQAYRQGAPQNPYDTGLHAGSQMLVGGQSPALLMAQQMPLYDPTFQPAPLSFGSPAPLPAVPTAPYIGAASLAQQQGASIYQGHQASYGPTSATVLTPPFQWGTPATVPLPATSFGSQGMIASQPAYAPAGGPYLNAPSAPAWPAPLGAMPMSPQAAPVMVMPASGTMPMPSMQPMMAAPAPVMPGPQVVPAF